MQGQNLPVPLGKPKSYYRIPTLSPVPRVGHRGKKWCRLVLRPEREAPRPEFDSPLLQKGWFDSNSVAEGCGSNAHREDPMVIDGVMYYTAEEVIGGASLFGVTLAFGIIGVLLLLREIFK